MYLDYWKLREYPFENVPDPSFFYFSRSHREALTRLLYAAKMRKGGGMLSGEVGCGKTTLAKVCIQELPEEKFDIGLIINPKLESTDFLQEVLHQFGISDLPETKGQCLRLLNEKMLNNRHENRETLLLIDEAQLLNEETLEEIRLLLNFQLNDRFLITVILLGQPELIKKIRNIEQLNQRIAIKYHVDPFTFDETAGYVIFRQKKAGRENSAFSPEAVERIYDHSKGVPRKINNLCDLSLLIGSSKKKQIIDANIVESIIHDGSFF